MVKIIRQSVFKLRQPYPFYHKGVELVKIAVLLSVVGFFFEMVIVPFPRNPEEHLYPYWIISLFHVGVAVVCYVSYFFVLGSFVKEDDWRVADELAAVCGLLVLIGVGQWVIRPIIYSNNDLNFGYLFEEVWHACVSGGLIYLLVTLINLNFLSRKHENDSIKLKIVKKDQEIERVEIKTQNLSDDFELNPAVLICAIADGNYVKVYTNSESDQVASELKRITLQSMHEQLSNFPFILKTHRSYLVNTNYITNITGNAQGFSLDLVKLGFQIPVSRKHLLTFKSVMN